MMKKINITVLIIAFLGVFTSLMAKDVLVLEEKPLLVGMQLSVADTMGVEAFTLGKEVQYDQLKARVYLKYDHNSSQFVTNDFTQEVTVRVTKYNHDGIGLVPELTTTDFTLNVAYLKQASFKDIDYVEIPLLNGAVASPGVRVEIISFSNSAYSQSFTVQAEIVAERFIEFDASETNDLSLFGTIYNDRNELLVRWDPIIGAEEYELEWTYVNNIGPEGTFYQANKVPFGLNYFKNNATRVTIEDTMYQAPVIYERGYVVFRIRGIGIHLENHNLFTYGSWTTDDPQYVNTEFLSSYGVGSNEEGLSQNYFNLSGGHFQEMNWQSTVNFAEEGKNKVAVSYFDGSLRNRQVVSRINTEDETIVGETVYDFEGRPAVQILPVPTGQQRIEYNTGFNKNDQGEKFSAKDFDATTPGTFFDEEGNEIDTECAPMVAKLSDQTGAGKYYSPNIDIKYDKDNYVPNANGYPYTQIEYTNDNTGRIARQSGVGDKHTLGSGQETKYFYITPAQEEITRLFGNEVGTAVHYKKNMVQDANKQVSVSYLDAQGRTIATALAGKNPESLDKIFEDEDFTEELHYDLSRGRTLPWDLEEGEVATERLINDETGLEYTKSIGVAGENATREFTYSVETPSYNVDCEYFSDNTLQKFTQCYGCVLDISIMLIDKCGIPVMRVDTTTNHAILEQILEGNDDYEIPSSCEVQEDIVLSRAQLKAMDLSVGDFKIVKVIQMNQIALDYYEDKYFKSDCVTSFDSIIAQTELELEAEFSCGFDCENCAASVGDYNDLYNPITTNNECDPCLTYPEYEKLIQECEDICNNNDQTCDDYFKIMVDDMTPGGQYGLFLGDDGTTNTREHLLSIYNTGNFLKEDNADWRNPQMHQFAERFNKLWEGKEGFKRYLNEDGSEALVDIRFIPSITDDEDEFTLSPEITNGARNQYSAVLETLKQIGKTSSFKVYPEELDDVNDFITLFDTRSWAHSLVVYHPEFANSIFCFDNEEYYQFRADIVQFAAIEELEDKYDLATLLTEPWKLDPFTPSNTFTRAYTRFRYNNYQEALDGTRLSVFAINFITNACPGTIDLDGGENKCGDKNADCKSVLDGLTGLTLAQKRTAYVELVKGTYMVEGKLIFTPEEGELFLRMYLSIYNSIREDRFEFKQARYAIVNESYNSCMSNDNFHPFANNFFFYKYQVRETRSKISAWLNRNTRYRAISEYHNFDQPCSWLKRNLFKDKTPIYALSKSFLQSKGYETGECYDSEVFTALPENGEGEIDLEGFDEATSNVEQNPAPCVEKELRLLDQLENVAEVTYINNCGQCPVSFNTTNFLGEALGRGYFGVNNTGGSSVDIICAPDNLGSYIPSFAESWSFDQNRDQLVTLNVTDGMETDTTIEKILTLETPMNGSDESIEFHLFLFKTMDVLDFSDLTKNGVRATIDVAWEDLASLCCMSYLESDNRRILPANLYAEAGEGKTFSFGATHTSDTYRNEFARLEGYVVQSASPGMLFNSCDMTTCDLSPAANDIVTFLNMGIVTLEVLDEEDEVVSQSGVLANTNNVFTQMPEFQSMSMSSNFVPFFSEDLSDFTAPNALSNNYYLSSFIDDDVFSFSIRINPINIETGTETGESYMKAFSIIDPESGGLASAINIADVSRFVYVGAVKDVSDYDEHKTIELLTVLNDGSTKTYYLEIPFDLFNCETVGYRPTITE